MRSSLEGEQQIGAGSQKTGQRDQAADYFTSGQWPIVNKIVDTYGIQLLFGNEERSAGQILCRNKGSQIVHFGTLQTPSDIRHSGFAHKLTSGSVAALLGGLGG